MDTSSPTIVDMLAGEALIRFASDADGYYTDREGDNLYVLCVHTLRFPTYTSPTYRLHERIEYIEQLLNMPHSIGSVLVNDVPLHLYVRGRYAQRKAYKVSLRAGLDFHTRNHALPIHANFTLLPWPSLMYV